MLILRYYIVEPFYVVGSSMEVNYHDGDYLLVDRLSYAFSKPQRGDVVVFHYPLEPDRDYIKRIIGLPGEKVSVKDGRVSINGRVVEESYIPDYMSTVGNIDTEVPQNEYFVLGDNRNPNGSSDSREWGTVPQEVVAADDSPIGLFYRYILGRDRAVKTKTIIGKAALRIYPLNTLEITKRPKYPL